MANFSHCPWRQKFVEVSSFAVYIYLSIQFSFFLEYVRSVSWIKVDESGLFLFKTLDFPSSFFLHLASVFFYLILPCFTHMQYPMFSFTDEQKVDVKNSWVFLWYHALI